MLSNPLHRFSPYHALSSNTLMSNGHMSQGHMHTAGLDTLAQGSHYALQQLQQHVGVHNPHLTRAGAQMKHHRQHPYGPAARATGAAGPIRRRISRACDQCNQLRTKCDGQHPCAHCIGESKAFLRVFDHDLASNIKMLGIIVDKRLTAIYRIRPGVRVHPGAEEAWQGVAKGPGAGGRGRGCSTGRTKVPSEQRGKPQRRAENRRREQQWELG